MSDLWPVVITTIRRRPRGNARVLTTLHQVIFVPFLSTENQLWASQLVFKWHCDGLYGYPGQCNLIRSVFVKCQLSEVTFQLGRCEWCEFWPVHWWRVWWISGVGWADPRNGWELFHGPGLQMILREQTKGILCHTKPHHRNWYRHRGPGCLTPGPHRVRQRITHSFYNISHHTPAHVWGWTPSAIMVVHMHFSANTFTHASLPYCFAFVKRTTPHCFAFVKPNVVRCYLGMHVRWRKQSGPGVSVKRLRKGSLLLSPLHLSAASLSRTASGVFVHKPEACDH